MKLYRIWQDENKGYDIYDSAVVAAETPEQARGIHPREIYDFYPRPWDGTEEPYGSWCVIEKVQVEEIGDAVDGTKAGVILASFNAG